MLVSDGFETNTEVDVSCPRCSSQLGSIENTDCHSPDDVTTYISCAICGLLYWYSSYLKQVQTNGRQAI